MILEVLFNATKIDIKIAIELIFEIKVISVNTLIKKGKVRKFKKIFGKKKKIKKAYIKFSLFDKNKLN